MAIVESFSGIRGIFGTELTEELTVKYAYAFRKLLKKDPVVVIGRDSRESGEKLRNALIEGLDCNVIDVGVLPTPVIENAVREYSAAGGIIITASHNEPEYNGFKFLDKDGAVLRPKDMEDLINLTHSFASMDEEEFLSQELYKENTMKQVKRVDVKHTDALKRYTKFLKRIFKGSKRGL